MVKEVALDLKKNYKVTLRELKEQLIKNVIREGKVIYDNGTWERLIKD